MLLVLVVGRQNEYRTGNLTERFPVLSTRLPEDDRIIQGSAEADILSLSPLPPSPLQVRLKACNFSFSLIGPGCTLQRHFISSSCGYG